MNSNCPISSTVKLTFRHYKLSLQECIPFCVYVGRIPYSGKLSREKTFANFVVLWLFATVFSVKFGSVASFGAAKASNLRKFSQQKLYFSLIRESFLPRKFTAIWYLSLPLQCDGGYCLGFFFEAHGGSRNQVLGLVSEEEGTMATK